MKHFFISRIFWKIVYFRNPVKYARKIGVTIGEGSNFVDFPSFSSEPWLISIGDRTRISSDVSFITHDGGRWVLDHIFPSDAPFYKIGPIRIGNNCFVGMRTIILPNVSISDNCVIGGECCYEKYSSRSSVGGGSSTFYLYY